MDFLYPRDGKAAAAKFVELIGAAHARVDEYAIEFESDDRPKLRCMQYGTGTLPTLGALRYLSLRSIHVLWDLFRLKRLFQEIDQEGLFDAHLAPGPHLEDHEQNW
jgi:hypothetical protein